MIRRKFFQLVSAVALSAAFVVAPSFAGSPMINDGASTAGDGAGMAISGYDPVAYFTESKPMKGKAEYTLEYDGAMWQFASMENRDMFKADPMSYAPQYGGYCAYAVGKGKTKSIDPMAWQVVDNKLYLNHTKAVQETWSKDIAEGIKAADAMWPAVLK